MTIKGKPWSRWTNLRSAFGVNMNLDLSIDIRLLSIQCGCFSLPSVVTHGPYYNISSIKSRRNYSFMTFGVVL